MTEPTKEDLDQVPELLEALRAVAPSVPPVDEAAAEIAALKAKLKEAEEKLALLDTFVAEKVIEAFDQCIQIAANAAWYPCTPTEAPYNRGLNSGAVSMRQEIMAALLKAKFDLSPSFPGGEP